MRLLLDAHLSPALAEELRRVGIDAEALQDWLDGEYRHNDDEEILRRAAADARVFVTYDQRLELLLRGWAASEKHHAGVILVSSKSIRQDDVGAQLRALEVFVASHNDDDWTDEVRYLPRPSG